MSERGWFLNKILKLHLVYSFQTAYKTNFGEEEDDVDNESDSCSDFDEDEDPDKIEVPGK